MVYNLREATRSQNEMNKDVRVHNTSGVTGVHWAKNNNAWCVMITKDKKRHNLGYYTNFDDAVKVRQEAEIKYFGKYSWKGDKLL